MREKATWICVWLAAALFTSGVVVSVVRRVQHPVYGKTQKRTTRFLAHNEGDAAKMGDTVAIAETRPMSARKRWTVTRVIERAAGV